MQPTSIITIERTTTIIVGLEIIVINICMTHILLLLNKCLLLLLNVHLLLLLDTQLLLPMYGHRAFTIGAKHNYYYC